MAVKVVTTETDLGDAGFRAGVKRLIDQYEKGYVNDPADRGGKTRYGITEATARENGYKGDMADLPRDVAEDIYRKQYWMAPKLDKVSEIDAPLAGILFNLGVLRGCNPVIKGLQTALNYYGCDLNVDGVLGTKTLDALKDIAKRYGLDGVALGVASESADAFRRLAFSVPSQRGFLRGWLNRAGGVMVDYAADKTAAAAAA